MDSTYKARVQYFKATLSIGEDDEEISPDWKPVVDMKTFREACFYGIPDESCVRSTAWKVLLGYLPPDKRTWNNVLTSQRLCYYNWVKDLLQDPGEEPPTSDHPLNAEPGSKWAAFFRDNTILEQIDKDVRRTLPDLAFFQSLVPRNPLNPLSPPPTSVHEDEPANKAEADHPLSGTENVEKPTNRKLSLSFIGGRSRSSSTASKKSFKGLANNSDGNRSRSNSKSSVRSSHSVVIADGSSPSSTPRSIVRKFSSAFKLNNASSSTTSLSSKKKHDLHNVKPICPYVTNRRTIFSRIAHLNLDSSSGEKPASADIRRLGDPETQDHHWEAIERVLFIYAKLNPGVGYVQGMNELLAPIYYVFAKDKDPDAQAHAEADAFFVFTTLMADLRDHFVRSLDHDASSGINATMQRMSLRLSWVDRPLWRDLKRKDIKEQYYAFRWITVMCCQEWDLPDVIRLWDSLLADRQSTDDESNAMTYEFLLDFTVAMLLAVRKDLLRGDFAENMRMLQNYPVEEIQTVLKIAYSIREKRLKAVAAGQTVPGVNDKRNSGLLSYDWSDTSSVASNGSSRLQRLRETTDMARHSIEAFRKESRESLDEFFRAHRAADPTDMWKRASTGEMTRSLSQKLASMGGGLASKMRRSSSVNNPNGIQGDRVVQNTLDNHNRRMSTTLSNPHELAGTLPNRTNSLRNRLNQIMKTNNTTISPYNRLKTSSTSTQSSSTRSSPIYTRSSNDGNKGHFSPLDSETREYSSGYV